MHCGYLITLSENFRKIYQTACANYANTEDAVRYPFPRDIVSDEKVAAHYAHYRSLSGQRSNWANTIRHIESFFYISHEKDFIRKLLTAYPKNGTQIRGFIKKAGYASDFECAYFLQRTLGRSEGNAYLFVGLPNEKRVNELALLQIKAKRKDELLSFFKDQLLSVRQEAEIKLKDCLKQIDNPKITQGESLEILEKFKRDLYDIEQTQIIESGGSTIFVGNKGEKELTYVTKRSLDDAVAKKYMTLEYAAQYQPFKISKPTTDERKNYDKSKDN
jgi:hypothetical protein